ncbi:MAG: hypothetical protein GY754_06940 [bacterium]|nr:hypothetical protein [bacterium]
MKTVLLITCQNSRYKDALIKADQIVIPYNQPVTKDEFEKIKKSRSWDYAIVEPDLENIAATRMLLSTISRNGRVICIVNDLTDALKKILLENGISDVIQADDIKRLLAYIKVFNKEAATNAGKILILDDNPTTKKILKSIITRFNYKPVFAASTDALFKNLGQANLQLILMNLGLKNLDLNDLIRKSYSQTDLKRIPVIAFRDMSTGLFVHELISGLNKLTKFILSPDELYSFLIDILFRKEIIPVVGTINKSVNYEGLSFFSKETLSQIYHTNENSIFTYDNLLHEDNIEGMLHLMTLFKKTVIKADGFKWLRKKIQSPETKTCGVYG